ncbi:MAG: DUF3560 domain-containing protein [Bacteroidia bacterium]|nr:DUF3560 domain-containing protein [Bacteroidia bacterium]
MNTYAKYAPNVYVAKCTEKHEKGEVINVTTRHGKENESIIFNFLLERDGFFYYSILRADGFNTQQWAKRRAERLNNSADKASGKSDVYYNRSNKDSDFLSLGEPIKIGHHSERRHRKIIEQANNNTRKSIEFSEKSESLKSRADFYERKQESINLSMPESIEYYKNKLEEAKEKHTKLKTGIIQRSHSSSLTYAKKTVNELEKNLKLAIKLWGE